MDVSTKQLMEEKASHNESDESNTNDQPETTKSALWNRIEFTSKFSDPLKEQLTNDLKHNSNFLGFVGSPESSIEYVPSSFRWNTSSVPQAIGRGVRHDSHQLTIQPSNLSYPRVVQVGIPKEIFHFSKK